MNNTFEADKPILIELDIHAKWSINIFISRSNLNDECYISLFLIDEWFWLTDVSFILKHSGYCNKMFHISHKSKRTNVHPLENVKRKVPLSKLERF